MATNEPTKTELKIAETLLAKGNDASAVAAMLGIPIESLRSIVDEMDQIEAARVAFEVDGAELVDIADDLGLTGNRPYLQVNGWARKYGWKRPEGYVKPVKKAASTGRPRVDNGPRRLREAAMLAIDMAKADDKLNLKLAQIRAAAQVGVTDLNGMTPILQKEAPTLWKPRNTSS